MKKVYKIYFWVFALDYSQRKYSAPIPSPVECPDFNTEDEAEKWLIKNGGGDKFPQIEKYFVISPTFKMDAA